MQVDDRGKLQPQAYASRSLNKAESNYSTTHLEALAVVWALKHYRDIIYGYDIKVRTDHAAVVELFNAKSLTGELARWSLIIQDYGPEFRHIPGAVNHVADALSRYVGVIDSEDPAHRQTITLHPTPLSVGQQDQERKIKQDQQQILQAHRQTHTHTHRTATCPHKQRT